LHKELSLRKFSFLILDESTAVKNFKSQQSRACYNISTSVPRKFILSGTPIMNSPLDIFAQYKILSPLIFGLSFYRFRNRYAVMGGWNYKVAIQWKGMEDLKRRVFECATRKTKDECLDLPDKLYQVIKVDLTDEQKEIYKSLKEQFIYEFKDIIVTAPIVLTRLMRFSQITAGFTKDVEGIEHAFKKNPKVDWLIEFLNDLDVTRKVVIFCRFRHEITMVEEALRKARIKYVSVHGGVSDRIPVIKAFNNDASIRCFIGQQQTAGIGINLTSASYCVFLSNSYSYGDRIQAEDRTHRIGQTRNVTYIDVLARGTVDEGIHKALRKKESLSAMVMGDIIKMV
jgi:SNF2 family DNA or RNA helicase